jgi:hypothetical protein
MGSPLMMSNLNTIGAIAEGSQSPWMIAELMGTQDNRGRPLMMMLSCSIIGAIGERSKGSPIKTEIIANMMGGQITRMIARTVMMHAIEGESRREMAIIRQTRLMDKLNHRAIGRHRTFADREK